MPDNKRMDIRIVGDKELAFELGNKASKLGPQLGIAVKKSLALLIKGTHKKLTGGNPINVDTGRLRSSIVKEFHPVKIGGAANPWGKVGPGRVKYARILHDGGTITPVRAKFLTIPFPGIRRSGMAGARARDFKDTFIAKNVIFQKLSGGGIRPLFALKKSVKIPRRPYMTMAFTENLQKVYGIFERTVKV